MPTTPQPITLRPLTAADLTDAKTLTKGFSLDGVYVQLTHAGQAFYCPGTIKSVEAVSVFTGGLLKHQLATARKDIERVIIGEKIQVVVADEYGHEVTDYVFTSPEVFDALYPEGDGNQTRTSMLNRCGKRVIAMAGNGGPDDFEAHTVPVWGAEANLRLFIEDGDPEEIIAELTALLATKGRVVRAQARPLADFRVDVTETLEDENFHKVSVLRAVNVLEAEVWEFMRGKGAITTRSIPYGAQPPVVGS